MLVKLLLRGGAAAAVEEAAHASRVNPNLSVLVLKNLGLCGILLVLGRWLVMLVYFCVV